MPEYPKLYRTQQKSLDEYLSSLTPYQAEMYQLSPGLLTASNEIIQLDGCRLMKQYLSQGALFSVKASGDVGFCFPLCQVDFFWRGRRITFDDQFAVLAEDLEDLSAIVVLPPAMQQVLISFSKETLLQVLPEHDYLLFRQQVQKIFFKGMRYKGKAQLTSDIEAFFDRTASRIEKGEQFDDLHVVAELARLILSYISCEADSEAQPTGRLDVSYQKILNRIIKSILAQPAPAGLDDLARSAYTSKRNLNYAFKTILHIPPVRFINLVRLNHLRNQLKLQNSQKDIARVMSDMGYTNHSRVTREYCRHFGEHPRETFEIGLAERQSESVAFPAKAAPREEAAVLS